MITANHLTHNQIAASQNSFNTASISPGSNRLVIVAVGSDTTGGAGGNPNTPTLSGGGMTNWTQIATIDLSADHHFRITLFRALQASPGSGVIVIDFAGQNQGYCIWSITEFIGVITTGTNGADAVIQSANNTGASVTSLAITLGAFGNPNNATFGAVYTDGVTGITKGANFTELSNFLDTMETEWANNSQTNVNWTLSSTNIVGLAIEIADLLNSPSISPSASLSPSSSASSSASASLSSSASASLSPSSSSSASSSASTSSSASASPSQGFEDYTRQEVANLPTDNSDLSTVYTLQEKTEVNTYDGQRVGQVGTLDYMLHQFKLFIPENNGTVLFKGQTTLSPSASPVYLQIYNRISGLWETLDSNNSASAYMDFRLSGDISDMTDYKDHDQVVSCRIWQLAI